MCEFVFTKSMVMGVKNCIFPYFLHQSNNCEKSQFNNFKGPLNCLRVPPAHAIHTFPNLKVSVYGMKGKY